MQLKSKKKKEEQQPAEVVQDPALTEEEIAAAEEAAIQAKHPMLAKRISVHEAKAEFWLGIVFIAVSVLLFLVIIPTQVKYVASAEWFNSPRLFPHCIAGLIGVLGIAQMVNGLKQRNIPIDEQKEYSISLMELRLVALTLVLIALYVFAMKWIPYIPATIVVLAVLIYLYGQRNYIKIGAASVGMAVIIYLAFTYLLKLRLP